MGKHLISVDELRAMGALDVPEARRKSLGNTEKNLFSQEVDEDQASKERKKRPAKSDANQTLH